MRLIRHDPGNGEPPRLALASGEGALDARDVLAGGPATLEELLAGGSQLRERLASAASAARSSAAASRPLADLRLLAPISRPGKIIAVGRNYREHATEEGVEPPTEPLLFAKFPSSIVGPGADVIWDGAVSVKVDYEAELAVVIGTTARGVTTERALDHVLGYTCLNDVSARDLQFADGQWVRGKSLDTFCPVGPALLTADEIPDPQALAIGCRVNGEVRQAASTADMLFGVADLIAWISRFIRLDPGDVIATGTPPGVGVFRDPPLFLADGDEMVVEIEGIGRLVNRCVVTSR